jgi:radical SAM/Cys-rich protein
MFPPLKARSIETLQVNVGKFCNLVCKHCHVDAGPKRTEAISRETAEQVIAALARYPGIRTLDITGGEPELSDQFRYLVAEGRRLDRHVIDRSNLTVFFEPGQDDLPDFLRSHQVEVTASLPCYTRENVDRQRGKGVYEKSIRALQWLNRLGYGKPGSGLELNLVSNPLGAYLPASQINLEADYRRELAARAGVVFNHLFTITNMPISRFRAFLEVSGKLGDYMAELQQNHNPAAVDRVMCRSLVSVGWDGRLYDCDFNQMLDLPLAGHPHIRDFDEAGLVKRSILTADHCFGCTAGAGSSCGGALLS